MDQGELTRRGSDAITTLTHRGPDGRDIKVGNGWVMGHTRLAIIDLDGSAQPMSTPDGRHWLTFNGEIYNYRELHASLQSRWSFRTSGDTEVLLAGLVLDGPDFLGRANGMWAFALWDAFERRLILARDRLGKKPLHFRTTGGAMACASELPALRSLLPRAAWNEDIDSTSDFFRYGFALPGRTAWLDTHEVLPGHWLEWSPDRAPRQSRYWSVDASPFVGDRRDAAVAVREFLSDSVRLRLVADVEVGCFLSGGVDSSLIATLAATRTDHRLRTFSIGFADPHYDESWAARRIAGAIGSLHESETIDAMHAENLDSVIGTSVGQPFADPSLLPTSILSRLTAKHAKVALSGDGGDELFAGYQRYLGRVLLRWYTRLPLSLRHGAERALRAFPEPLAHHSRSVLKKAHLFAATASGVQNESAYVAPRLFSDAQLAQLAPGLCERGHTPPALPEQCRIDDVQQMMAADALTYLPQDILAKTDRASMTHSLEVRSPFLDHRLVELALTIGTSAHLRRFRGKHLLREALGPTIPRWVWQRRKQGFAVPVGAWFHGESGQSFERCIGAQDTVVQQGAALALLSEHRSGSRDHGLRLWALWSYFKWRSGEVGRAAHSPQANAQ